MLLPSIAEIFFVQILTLAPAGEVSVSLSDNGWAWLVRSGQLILSRICT
jgi:hypothetical protein